MTMSSLETYLREHDVPYSTLEHPAANTAQEVAASAHIRSSDMAKTVLVKIDDPTRLNNRMAMVVVPANERVHLGHVRDLVGSNHVELATEAEFKSRFPGCEVGAMPPFGNLYGMEVIVSDALAAEPEIAFNAGSHHEVMQMQWRDFERLEHPRVAMVTYH